jgi:hypothetical protein
MSGCGPSKAELERQAREQKAAVDAAVAAELAKKQKEEQSTLEVIIGVTMKSGDAKPFANGRVYLSTKPVADIFRGLSPKIGPETPLYPLGRAIFADQGTEEKKLKAFLYFWKDSEEETAPHRAYASAIAEKASVATASTDFNGSATFEGIPRGDYYIICATALGGGAVFEKPVSLKAPKTKVSLSNEDFLQIP